MRRFFPSAGLLFLILSPLFAYAALTPEGPGFIRTPDIPSAGTPTPVVVTCYGPGGGGIQGGISSSKPDKDGQTIIHTLDDVRLGRSQYVTLAGNPANYNKWFDLGAVDYVSPLDGREYTIPKVVGLVHDTGGAFMASGCAQYNTCGVIDRKFDVAVGDFRGKSLSAIYQSKFCSRMQQTWLQVGGAVGVASAPYGQPTSPYSYASAVPLGAPTGVVPGQPLPYDYYCVDSMNPVHVTPLPAGTVFPSNCYNSSGAAQRPPPPPPPQQTAQAAPVQQSQTQANRTPSVFQQISQLFTPAPAPVVQPSAILLVQPSQVSRGNPVVVSWSSVGMKTDTPCRVIENDNYLLAQGNSGTKLIETSHASPTGTLAFSLQCSSQTGIQVQKSASVLVQ